MSNLPRATTLNGEIIPPDRIYGAGLTTTVVDLPLFTALEADMDRLIHEAKLNQQIYEHVQRNRQRRHSVPRWHHWRIGRLAINWRWCKS